MCCFCTCHPVSFLSDTCNIVVSFHKNFVNMVCINFKSLFILDLSCFECTFTCLHFCLLFIVWHNLCSAVIFDNVVHCLALQRNCIVFNVFNDYCDLQTPIYGMQELFYACNIIFSSTNLFRSVIFVFGYSASNILMAIKVAITTTIVLIFTWFSSSISFVRFNQMLFKAVEIENFWSSIDTSLSLVSWCMAWTSLSFSPTASLITLPLIILHTHSKCFCSATSSTVLTIGLISSLFMYGALVFALVLGHSFVSFNILHVMALLYSFLYRIRFFGLFGCLK